MYTIDCSTVIPSYACEITNLRTSSNASRTPCSSSLALNHRLQLFVFLEDSSDCKKTGLGKNSQWKQSTELHHRLRGLFQKLVVDHSKKFHQAIHSALNKLICNYGSYAKVCVYDPVMLVAMVNKSECVIRRLNSVY